MLAPNGAVSMTQRMAVPVFSVFAVGLSTWELANMGIRHAILLRQMVGMGIIARAPSHWTRDDG